MNHLEEYGDDEEELRNINETHYLKRSAARKFKKSLNPENQQEFLDFFLVLVHQFHKNETYTRRLKLAMVHWPVVFAFAGKDVKILRTRLRAIEKRKKCKFSFRTLEKHANYLRKENNLDVLLFNEEYDAILNVAFKQKNYWVQDKKN